MALSWLVIWIAIGALFIYFSKIFPSAIMIGGFCVPIAFIGAWWLEALRQKKGKHDKENSNSS